jgi:hypothetical protein
VTSGPQSERAHLHERGLSGPAARGQVEEDQRALAVVLMLSDRGAYTGGSLQVKRGQGGARGEREIPPPKATAGASHEADPEAPFLAACS